MYNACKYIRVDYVDSGISVIYSWLYGGWSKKEYKRYEFVTNLLPVRKTAMLLAWMVVYYAAALKGMIPFSSDMQVGHDTSISSLSMV